MILLRRFATESAREEARMFCDELMEEEAVAPHDLIASPSTSFPRGMHRAMSEFEAQSGKHMLALSSSQFDPNRTFANSSNDPASRTYRLMLFGQAA